MEVLNAQRVKQLYKELAATSRTQPATTVHGVMVSARFNLDQLRAHRQEIGAMLSQVCTTGDFFGAVMDRWNRQWTHDRMIVDRLLTMGAALGLVKFTQPRNLWVACPQGPPFVVEV